MTWAAQLQTKQAHHHLQLQVAHRFHTRLRGLMFARPLPENTGLLITRCASVHTCFMRYPLDLIYLNQSGTVVHCVQGLKPWRLHWPPKAANKKNRAIHVLELCVGSVRHLNIAPMDRLKCAFLE